MKIFNVKIVLWGIGALTSGMSLGMFPSKSGKYNHTKTSRHGIKVINLIEQANSVADIPLALPALRPAMEPNFFTELPKELRADCVPSRKPKFTVCFMTRDIDCMRNKIWLQDQLSVSSTSRYSRLVMLRDNPELASFIRRSNGVRLEPNPTAAVSVAFERGLLDKAGLRFWDCDKGTTEYERSHADSIESYELMARIRYNQQNPPLIKCSIQ